MEKKNIMKDNSYNINNTNKYNNNDGNDKDM